MVEKKRGRPKKEPKIFTDRPIIDDRELVKLCRLYDLAARKRETRNRINTTTAQQKWRRLTPEQRKEVSKHRRRANRMASKSQDLNKGIRLTVNTLFTGEVPKTKGDLKHIALVSKMSSKFVDEQIKSILQAATDDQAGGKKPSKPSKQ